ncbi:predicted protein, partial [Arabidopsis lyrata subsp. lyrata]
MGLDQRQLSVSRPHALSTDAPTRHKFPRKLAIPIHWFDAGNTQHPAANKSASNAQAVDANKSAGNKTQHFDANKS